MIETQQELIQIGSSEGVILSKKDLARIGAKRGDILNLKYELAQKQAPQSELVREYASFVAKYGQTLKNLADRWVATTPA